MTGADKKEYEVAFLTREEGAAGEVARMLRAHDAEVNLEGPVKRISLAYKIKKELQAYFGYFEVRMPADKISELQKAIRLNPAVLRCLVIVKPFVRPQESLAPRLPRESVAKDALPPKAAVPLSNEELERKIDEILS